MQMQGVGRYAAVAFDLMELFTPCGLLIKTPLVGGAPRMHALAQCAAQEALISKIFA